eukprot:ctg_2528.g564
MCVLRGHCFSGTPRECPRSTTATSAKRGGRASHTARVCVTAVASGALCALSAGGGGAVDFRGRRRLYDVVPTTRPFRCRGCSRGSDTRNQRRCGAGHAARHQRTGGAALCGDARLSAAAFRYPGAHRRPR